MHVQYDSTLMLYNLSWIITKKTMAEPLHGCSTLECFGSNTTEAPAIAADCLHGDFHIKRALPDTKRKGNISLALYKGVYNSGKCFGDPSTEKDEDWLEIDIDHPSEEKAAINYVLCRATEADISNNGSNEFSKFVIEVDEYFLATNESGTSPEDQTREDRTNRRR